MKQLSGIQRFYLFSYNALLFVLHFIGLVDVLTEKFKKDRFNLANHYNYLVICTFFQLGDLFHAKIGLTKTNIPAGLMQIFGRLLVLYTAHSSYSVYTLPTTFFLILAYFTIECIRYPYYALKVINQESIILSWLRYNSFLVLYPIGFVCEAITFYQVLMHHHLYKKLFVSEPFGVKYNVDFSIVFGAILVIVFPYTVYTLFTYMLKQRAVQNKLIYKKMKSA